MPAATIYKLLTGAEWGAAQGEGVYRGSAHDRRDGFIHFSTAAQLEGTARNYFAGVADLVLLMVDVEVLTKLAPPHPMEEGTVWHAPGPIQASPLPGGDGQGEGSCLHWEPARDGSLFPHLYADLPIAAVASATSIPLDAQGNPILPAELAP